MSVLLEPVEVLFSLEAIVDKIRSVCHGDVTMAFIQVRQPRPEPGPLFRNTSKKDSVPGAGIVEVHRAGDDWIAPRRTLSFPDYLACIL